MPTHETYAQGAASDGASSNPVDPLVLQDALRDRSAKEALVRVIARVDALLAALEARPDNEGPLEACQALLESDEGQVLTVGTDEMLVIGLIDQSPSLAGRLLWKTQAVTGRLARELGRRMGLPPTDLRSQLVAANVVAAFNASVAAWLSDPSGPPVDQLMGRALAHTADGAGWQEPCSAAA
jgi:hypothetical protein